MWRRIFGRPVPDSDLEDELEGHLAIEVKQLMEGGMNRREAELAARRQLGNRALILEETRAVRSHGGRGFALLANLILPGALVQILLGIRTSVAYGWRALVASEMIAGSNGLGYMTMEGVQRQRTDTSILGMIVIGLLWVAMDRLIFTEIERRTVGRWGLMQR